MQCSSVLYITICSTSAVNVLQCDVLVLVRDRQEELQVEITERKKAIEIEEKEIVRKEKELEGIVRKPAEAEAFRVEQVANASRYHFISSFPLLFFPFISFTISYHYCVRQRVGCESCIVYGVSFFLND